MAIFLVGDRVKVYMENVVAVGSVLGISAVDNGWLNVQLDEGRLIRPNKKQCRKLVKKKRREFWLVRYSELGKFHVRLSKPEYTSLLRDSYYSVIKVREVKDAAQELPEETKSK